MLVPPFGKVLGRKFDEILENNYFYYNISYKMKIFNRLTENIKANDLTAGSVPTRLDLW